LPPERHLQPYVFRSPFQSSLLSQQALRRSRKRDSRGRTESEFEKDVLRAGVGVVKGVVGTAFGVLGTVVEGGATVASKIDKSGGDFTPILPPMTLRAGPVRNIFQNNILTENLAKRFKMLGISTPFELQCECRQEGLAVMQAAASEVSRKENVVHRVPVFLCVPVLLCAHNAITNPPSCLSTLASLTF
jgi:hypothetical protein